MMNIINKSLDLMAMFTIITIMILVLTAWLFYLQTGETDMFFEELAEDIIEWKIGTSIDLSPGTREN